ncbi:MAG TPA: PhzF family phenazine biosynthesis protein [Terriglobales bacterium]|nr:PhzF family phenazine biosynthesis protein [Terriglobales bacterium]
MVVPIYQVDAFASKLFEGNPAAVVCLKEFPSDAVMQQIAAENNLAETAFLVSYHHDYRLRWFTPKVEVPLCGHATLASAAVVMERLEPGRNHVVFHTRSGELKVSRADKGYVMDFPARESESVIPPEGLSTALGTVPVEVYSNVFNYMVVVDSPRTVRGLTPDPSLIAQLDRPGVIVTSPGDGEYDFISRYFAPAKGIPEDPVTGAAHCMLVPYWAKRLKKSEFNAYQVSPRGGRVRCRGIGGRVELQGECAFYLEGSIHIPKL